MSRSVAHALIEKCQQWHQLFSRYTPVYYSRLSIERPATAAELERFEAQLKYEACPQLIATWQVCGSVHFEWFVKQRAMQAVGIDSRRSPGGRFQLFSPAETLKEKSFLLDLGDDNDPLLAGSLPFGKVGENGELVVINHTETARYSVDVILLDNELNRVRICDDFEAWLTWRTANYMEDSLLSPDDEATHEVSAVLDSLRNHEGEWPPPDLRESPFEGG
ncbi:MAG: hypothetical protein VX589_03590 [Myxococcota bacterium]|nr:hypothetical protein [Myxococcota bacterium]